MAEAFHGLTGLGDDKTISVIDFLGLLAAALQHTLLRVQMLEAKEMAGRVH
jgi:hypothetical protein